MLDPEPLAEPLELRGKHRPPHAVGVSPDPDLGIPVLDGAAPATTIAVDCDEWLGGDDLDASADASLDHDATVAVELADVSASQSAAGNSAGLLAAAGDAEPTSDDSELESPGDFETPIVRRRGQLGAAASVMLHLALLAAVSQIRVPETNRTLLQEFSAAATEEFVPSEQLPQDEPLLSVGESTGAQEMVSGELAASAAVRLSQEPVVAGEVSGASAGLGDIQTIGLEAPGIEMVASAHLSDVLARPGGMGEQIARTEGGVDRVSLEIAALLAQSDVLVVWMLDASISLAPQREAVAERLEKIYREIEENGEVSEGALLGAVFRYGAAHDELVKPTDDGSKIVEAIRSVAPDDSGVENVFSCIVAAVNKYKSLATRQHRKMVLINWTDESGDDNNQLESAVQLCRKLAIPVYTIGPSSMFGREQGIVAYRHPENNEVYYLPVDQGPDTVRQEMIRLPFWFDGPQFDHLRAGVGPYALTRLSSETGGAYFIHDTDNPGRNFNIEAMQQYLPDYSSAKEYSTAISKSRLRQVILQAVDLTEARELKGTPQLSFEPTGSNFQQELSQAQQSVAYNLLTLQAAISLFGNGMEKDYQQEPSARWRAWYDLTFGRLLAMNVRCNEYNWQCAVMKGKGSDFVDKQSNRWRFMPDSQLHFGSAAERQAAEATRLLTRCVEQNPGTPWELLAKRELADAFGFRVEEAYVEPPKMDVRPGGNPNDNPGRREEQMRKLRRDQATLPKL